MSTRDNPNHSEMLLLIKLSFMSLIARAADELGLDTSRMSVVEDEPVGGARLVRGAPSDLPAYARCFTVYTPDVFAGGRLRDLFETDHRWRVVTGRVTDAGYFFLCVLPTPTLFKEITYVYFS